MFPQVNSDHKVLKSQPFSRGQWVNPFDAETKIFWENLVKTMAPDTWVPRVTRSLSSHGIDYSG